MNISDLSTSDLLGSLLTSLVSPLVLNFLIQTKWSEKVKYLCSVLFTLLSSTIIVGTQPDFSLAKLIDFAILTLVLTETNYKVWFKKSLVESYLNLKLGKTNSDVSKEETLG